MLQATGILSYEANYRLVVSVSHDLAAYYRALIPKHFMVQKPRWSSHITVVRPEKEVPVHIAHWGKYAGEEVEFSYDPDIRIDKTYYWINVWCDRLAEIRRELGLPPKSRWTRPPSGGYHECFHLTIGNRKFFPR